MKSATNSSGILFFADTGGKITEVRRDDFGIVKKGMPFISIVDPPSISKVLSFLDTLKREETLLGWEVIIPVRDSLKSLYIGGTRDNEKLVIFGSTDHSETAKMFNDFMQISNTQSNQLRNAIKANLKATNTVQENESSFDRMTELNNRLVTMQRDLAKRNHAYEIVNRELEVKNQELRDFAYIVSHDLKAPLRGISSVIDMIVMDHEAELSEEVKALFALIKERAVRMHDLVTSVLAYSRAGRARTNVTTFPLSKLLHEVMGAIDPPARFHIDLPESLPEMTCSYVQLGQIFTNLLSNAIKYHHKEAGTIRIRVKEHDAEHYGFSVIDDGPGIPEKYHERIFRIMETANAESRTDSTGVGLAIVKKLVNLNGGEVGLHSVEGKGATFWFTWPKSMAAQEEER